MPSAKPANDALHQSPNRRSSAQAPYASASASNASTLKSPLVHLVKNNCGLLSRKIHSQVASARSKSLAKGATPPAASASTGKPSQAACSHRRSCVTAQAHTTIVAVRACKG